MSLRRLVLVRRTRVNAKVLLLTELLHVPGGPDSMAPPSATLTSTSTSTSASTSSSASTSTPTSSSKSSTGAVPGGIIGGIIGVGLSVALVFWIRMRYRSQHVAQASVRSSGQEMLPSPLSNVNPPSMQHHRSYVSVSFCRCVFDLGMLI